MLTPNFVFNILYPKLKSFFGHVDKNYHFNRLNQFLKYDQIFQCTLPSSMRHVPNRALDYTFSMQLLCHLKIYSLPSPKLISGIYGMWFDIMISLVLFKECIYVDQRELEFENYLYNLKKEDSDLYTSTIFVVSCSCINSQVLDRKHQNRW